eukprot:Sdes_comp19777_c0_seq4m11836
MEAIDGALKFIHSKKLANNYLHKITVFCNVEPCIMCASALKLVQVKQIYFGCSNLRFGGCGSVLNLFSDQTENFGCLKKSSSLFSVSFVSLEGFYLFLFI